MFKLRLIFYCNFSRKLKIFGYFLISLVLTLSLQSCMSVASSGAEAVYNRQNITKNLTDQYLTYQVYKAIYRKTKMFDDANIVIATFNREMLLTGQAPERWQKSQAENIAKQIPGIEKIYNLIEIASPCSSFTHVSDSWITAKIKAKFLASNDIDAIQIKVLTENGTVYLMGIVLPECADAAVELARTTQGVGKVVKIFSYIHITKKA